MSAQDETRDETPIYWAVLVDRAIRDAEEVDR